MNIQHSSNTDRWHTPEDLLSCARQVLGGIDLDPCSEPLANERVGAAAYYTQEDDGLSLPWKGRVFVNCPGGRRDGRSNARLWWRKLMHERAEGALAHAIWLSFSLEHLQTTQGETPSILDFPICVPRKRVRFLRPDGTQGPSPSHSNVIAYVPGTVDRTPDFLHIFASYGKVKA